MDAIALLAAGPAVPADAKPASDAVPTDAFAAVFASAMGDAATPNIPLPVIATVLNGEAAVALPADPVALDSTVTPIQAAAITLPQVPEVDKTTPVATPVVVAEWPAETTVPVDAPVVEQVAPENAAKESAPKRPAGRGKARTEAPVETVPETPSPTAEAVTPEKEAPTPAPNAPVAPLDRISKEPTDEKTEQTDTAVPQPMVLTANPTAVPQNSPQAPVETGGATPRVEAAAVSAPQIPQAAAPKVSKKVDLPKDGKTADTAFDPSSVETLDVPAEGNLLASAPILSGSSEMKTVDLQTSEAAVLPSATDLGAVPTIVEASSAPGAAPLPSSPATAATAPTGDALTVPNERIAKVAADRIDGAAVEGAASKTIETKASDAKIELKSANEGDGTVFAETTSGSTQGGSAQGEEAPSDGRSDAPMPTPEAAPVSRTAATERPEAGIDRPEVDRHLVVRQVADRIENLVAARPRDGVTIHLEPQDLGTVTLVVKGLSSALDVQVTASDDRVRQSLDASRPELAQALAPRGIELRELRVATNQAGTNGSASSSTNLNSGGQSNPQQGQGRPQTPTSQFTAKSSRGEAATPRASRRSGRGVDLLA